MPTRARAPLPLRLASIPLVAIVVLAGIWVAGGLLTNDFKAAMALTAAWMVVAGIACAVVARRRPDFRWPVLIAFLVTAALAGAYLGRSQFVDDVVHERVVTGPPVLRGEFEPVAHPAEGTARVIETGDHRRVLTLTSFDVSNGPDLRVYLVAGPARTESEVDDFEDLGALKGNKGNQQYDLPSGIDLGRHRTVVIWCRAFSVNFARAPLR